MIDIRSLQFDGKHVPIVPQVCNNLGKYGAGYSGAIASRWPMVEHKYREWHIKGKIECTTGSFELGQNQYVNCGNAIIVNMIAQDGVRSYKNSKVISYKHLCDCLYQLNQYFSKFQYPYKFYFAQIGSGLAGGNWEVVEHLIRLCIPDNDRIILL